MEISYSIYTCSMYTHFCRNQGLWQLLLASSLQYQVEACPTWSVMVHKIQICTIVYYYYHYCCCCCY